MPSADVKTRARRQLPLKPVAYLILFSLIESARHGYGVKKRVEELSGGAVRLDPGTLYRWMARLLEDGWIAETERRPLPDEDERRRYYELTELGRELLRLESTRLARLVDGARGFDLVGKAGEA